MNTTKYENHGAVAGQVDCRVRLAEAHQYPACKGTNCGCTDGVSHSPECHAEHESIVFAAARADHVERGGWPCYFCGYTGQNNQRHNMFCSACSVHR